VTAARAFLERLGAVERAACIIAFAVMAIALIADVARRVGGRVTEALSEVPGVGPGAIWLQDTLGLGAGILGAPQVSVIGMITVAMVGFGLAAASGGQLRARFFDGLCPSPMVPALTRFADLLTAAMLAVLAALALQMTLGSARLGDVVSVTRWPIWPMQAIIVAAFTLNAVRYLLFALFPELRPPEDPAPETAEQEEVVR
jgi:TRAP-type C4-dicarboxylate transport system permease small subunit